MTRTPQQRILDTLVGMAEELLLDVADDRSAEAHHVAGELYFFRAGHLNASAFLTYVFHRDALSDLNLYTVDEGDRYTVNCQCSFTLTNAQEAVDTVAHALVRIAGRDPQLTSAGPRRPPVNRGLA